MGETSSSAKHTPGNWAVPDGGVYPMVATHDSTIICVLNDTGDVMEANARLMAAAPDLLAALKHAVRWHDQFSLGDVAKMKAAIASAEAR